MKKLLGILLLVAGSVYADPPITVVRSSMTQTNDTAYIAASNIVGVIVGATSAGGNLTIWDSTYTTSVVVTSITLGTVFQYEFSDRKVSGIYYKTTANTAGVTILYRK